jgi:FtsZ-binding cell division protein ZapB
MIDSNDIAKIAIQWGGGALAAIITIALTIQKLMRGWSADRVERVSDDAQTDVIMGLQTELRRVRSHNAILEEELNRVQVTMAKLAGDNARLRAEIDELQAKISQILRA